MRKKKEKDEDRGLIGLRIGLGLLTALALTLSFTAGTLMPSKIDVDTVFLYLMISIIFFSFLATWPRIRRVTGAVALFLFWAFMSGASGEMILDPEPWDGRRSPESPAGVLVLGLFLFLIINVPIVIAIFLRVREKIGWTKSGSK